MGRTLGFEELTKGVVQAELKQAIVGGVCREAKGGFVGLPDEGI